MCSIYSRICNENGIYVLLLYRTHSERLANKCKRPFTPSGSSMLDIKMAQLELVFPEDKIIVAGDDSVIDPNSEKIRIKRDTKFLIGNTIPFSDVLAHTYEKIIAKLGRDRVKHLLITYPTSPTFNVSCYRKAIVQYYQNVINGPYDSIMSGHAKPGFFWMNGKAINYEPNKNHKYTQDIDRVFEADNALWGGEFDKLVRGSYLINENPYQLENDRLHACDVDTPEDFEYAQLIYRNLKD